MKLIQIPFSHNCIKVRVALERKGIPYEVQDIPPNDRTQVLAASRQGLVPVLIDGTRTIVDSTEILLYLEDRFPEPRLIPSDPRARAECLVLEDWADRTFMALSRRIAYHTVLSTPGQIGRMFFPRSSGLRLKIQETLARRVVAKRFRISENGYPRDVAEARRAAALAVARIGSGPYLLGGSLSIADIALATMSAPFAVDPEVRKDPAIAALLAWGDPIIGKAASFYRGTAAA